MAQSDDRYRASEAERDQRLILEDLNKLEVRLERLETRLRMLEIKTSAKTEVSDY